MSVMDRCAFTRLCWPAIIVVCAISCSASFALADEPEQPAVGEGSYAQPHKAPQQWQPRLPLSTQQRRPLARLIRNPDRSSGLPAYALTDQAGTIQRYIEPVPGIDLEPYVGYAVTVKRDTGRTLLATQLGLPGHDSDDDVDDLHGASQHAATGTPSNIQALFANLVDTPASGVQQAQYVQAPMPTAQSVVVQGAQPVVVPQASPQVMLPPGAVPQGTLPPGVVPYDPSNPTMVGTPWNTYPQSVAPVYVDGANPCDMSCPPCAVQQVPCQVPCEVPCVPLVQVPQPPPPIRCSAWAEALYLHPTGVDMVHAQQQNGIGGAGTVPFGQIGVVNPDWDIGYRVGAEWRFDPKESIFGDYSWFDSSSHSTVVAPNIPGGGGAVGSLVQHPGAAITASAGPVEASYDIDFRLADIACRYYLACSRCGEVSAYWGGRWAELSQDFNQTGTFGGGQAGVIDTRTRISFDGFGPTVGLAGERLIGCTRFSAYGHMSASALEGQFKSHYLMNNATTVTTLAQADWNDDRIVPMLDYELGVAWTSPNGHVRLALGYMATHWFDIVSTPTLVQAVQNNNYVNVSDTLSFDGAVGHVEFRW
jgi:hypothetical protein